MSSDTSPNVPLSLSETLEQIRLRMVGSLRSTWPGGADILDRMPPQPMDPFVTMPVLAGVAAGAAIEDTIPFAVAWGLMAVSGRVLDDCADQDNPAGLNVLLGVPRAANFGTGLLMHAAGQIDRLPFPLAAVQRVNAEFHETVMRLFAGQDRDLSGPVDELTQYLLLIEEKTACAYAFGGVGAALLHTTAVPIYEACRRCGRHMGLMIQILDDLEAFWLPDSHSDLMAGKVTLPVFMGLAQEHEAQPELADLIRRRRFKEDEARIRAILDAMDIRQKMLWAALKERDAALSCVRACGRPLAEVIAESYVQWLFSDAQLLLNARRA